MEFERGIFTRFVLIVLFSACGYCSDCMWDKDKDFPRYPPLILDSSFQFVLPVEENGNRVVRLALGEIVTLACPGDELENLHLVEAKARCLEDGLLMIEDSVWDMASLGCGDDVKEMILRDQGACGAGDIGVLHEIGFEVLSAERFKKVLRVCFDPTSETTLYTEHLIHGASIAAKDIDSSRPSFKTSTGFFSVSMSSVYSQNSQLELMIKLLGDEDLAHQIIDTHKQLYFAKGHMSPDADFVIMANQDATYYYINAVPQWQAFNNGNWKYLEFATRDLAEKKRRDLRVYSGGWGVLELDDINGNPVEVFLGLAQEKKVVPAPAVTWKVVHDEVTNCAAAIVGVNNPHLTSAPSTLCEDLCSSLQWIDFDVADLEHGYTYCCSVADLRAAVPHVPDLGEVCLLTE
ncbi:uncharacterized protein LOC123498614 isoform X1 [Portunus trituberculatus]|uniref:uncharacterized protein LOC123498614 isoform X1 n=2 Tax=Portunus trituberculatus TaxID=210409 RepID=UPI001E1CEC01|nr:uncharacterized protein LOC123498614 isoform X1 [Portunus trituberculatus]XP_045101822.1 uncharacterized protein LOC123498614 isoform X1 [Portunus trituberculatus]